MTPETQSCDITCRAMSFKSGSILSTQIHVIRFEFFSQCPPLYTQTFSNKSSRGSKKICQVTNESKVLPMLIRMLVCQYKGGMNVQSAQEESVWPKIFCTIQFSNCQTLIVIVYSTGSTHYTSTCMSWHRQSLMTQTTVHSTVSANHELVSEETCSAHHKSTTQDGELYHLILNTQDSPLNQPAPIQRIVC